LRGAKIPPIVLPIIFFAVVILLGAALLHSSERNNVEPLSWTGAFFTSTSATCVTGLTVVDTRAYFTRFGQIIILCLIQVGGLGIMTFASLAVYLWKQRVSLTDRIAVGQTLLHDASFHLGKFLIRIVMWSFLIELTGSALLFGLDADAFSPFSAIFHAVSAYCNAGFSLFPNSLMDWKGDWGINLVFMALIFLGGIGFSVMVELHSGLMNIIKSFSLKGADQLSWYSKSVLQTSALLVILGAVAIYLAEFVGYHRMMSADDALLSALFQSVTCRTAGFNTLNIAGMTNISLLVMMILMFIGGAPGSCAGGIKVTTFRVLTALSLSQIKGRRQALIGKFAVPDETVKRALVLFVFAAGIIITATLFLDFSEGGDAPHSMVRGQFLEIVFEAISAFGTVGLSTGLTPKLTDFGKWIIILLMFIGRLGPLVLLSAVQAVQKEEFYLYPEESLMIG